MKNLFLDVGSNKGQAVLGHFARKLYFLNECDYILFEPNPICKDIILNNIDVFLNEFPIFKPYKSNIKLINCAAYIDNISKRFIFDGNTGQSGTIIDDHFSENRKQIGTTEIEVCCVNINDIIEENYKNYKEIILKLDCECSEYNILENLIENKNIFKIKKIYCEFHTRFMNSEDRNRYLKREHNIVTFLEKNNIQLINWK